MKFLRFFLFLSIAGLTFSSCQKELSAEAGAAKGTLKAEATGDCLPILINGSYQKDTLLRTVSNYVEVQIDVTTTGSYRISTDTVNGYYFSTVGVAAATGLQTVRIYGAGRPINPGVDIFTVTFDGTSCEFNVVVTGTGGGGGGTGTAVYTLGTTGTTCTGATTSGTFTQGASVSGNTATINVNVTTGGTYTLTSGSANGVTFTGSGTFTTTGPQTVTLTASGTAGMSTTANYPLTAGTSSCSFTVTYAPAGSAANYTINCTGAVVSGTYTAGTATTSSNQITLNVTVTTVGTYSITSTTVNSISFSGSGTFTTTGAQTVVLTAMGTPAAAGTNAYPLTGNASTCSVNVTVAGGSGTDFIKADVNGVTTLFNTGADAVFDNMTLPGYAAYDISGSSATGEYAEVLVAVPGSTVPNNIAYNANQAATTSIVYGDYQDAGGTDYNAQTMQTNPTPVFTVTITSQTATRVTGTFSGALYQDGTGPAVKTYTNGSFSLPLP